MLSVMAPVQSGFTVYVPSIVTLLMLPFELKVAVASVWPFPSKVCLPPQRADPQKGADKGIEKGSYAGVSETAP